MFSVLSKPAAETVRRTTFGPLIGFCFHHVTHSSFISYECDFWPNIRAVWHLVWTENDLLCWDTFCTLLPLVCTMIISVASVFTIQTRGNKLGKVCTVFWKTSGTCSVHPRLVVAKTFAHLALRPSVLFCLFYL